VWCSCKTGSFLVLSKGVNELNGVNNQIKPGCCAHGLPAGACPVCSMSGGGSSRKPDRSGRPGEMSYHQCAMIGNMMKARALAQKNHEANLKQHVLNLEQFEATMARLIQNMKNFTQILSQSFISKPVAFVFNITAIPLLNIIKNIPKVFQAINNLRFEITDKLAAIYGEARAFLLKKAEEGAKVLSSFFEKIFKTSKKNDADDDDTKVDDDKKIFNLKTIIHKIKEKFNRKKDKKE
jgi:hypothetical protein